MNLAPYAAAVIIFAALSTIALAEKVGTTVEATRTVRATGGGKPRLVLIDTDIFANDRLRANASGNAQIRLIDGTKIVVGPNADVKIDDFVFDQNKTVKRLTISATRGAFRFISGNSKHTAYKIKTPNGTIGVRGTAFDVTITNRGTNIALLRGAVNVCDRGQRCQEIKNRCDYALVNRRGVTRDRLNSEVLHTQAQALFPLLVNETRLRRPFKQYASGCTVRRAKLVPDKIVPARPAPVPISAPAAPDPPEPSPPDASPPDPGVPNNPGNGQAVGNSGEKFNDGQRGNSTNAPGRNK
ncbi:FecR family protein [Roseibium sp.]|uniref:FecR family protein n=1 Tax=Roseibium sp. TaxID=1936156 RepID=UPI003D0BCC1D